MISEWSGSARNTTLIKKCTTAAILRNEIFRLRVFLEGDSACNPLKNTNINIIKYMIIFSRFCVYQKYVQCLWSISDTFCHDSGFENARNRQISFRRIAAVVHFFIRVVFLAELEHFEIIKSN